MQDTIITGSGNSRSIRFPPNAIATWPNWPAFLADAISAAGVPIDLGPLNPAGVQQMGTNLTKANLLSEAVEKMIWGNAANRTPNQALQQLRTLIKNTDNKTHLMISGSYTGDGEFPKTVTFGFKAIFVFIRLVGEAAIGNYVWSVAAFGTGSHLLRIGQTTNSRYATIEDGDTVGSITNTGVTIPSSANFLNIAGAAYDYFAIG